MKNLLKLEELAQFLTCSITMFVINAPLWAYLFLLIGPDISMLGYLVNSRIGALSYNLFHHKGVALAFILAGFAMGYGERPPETLLQEGSISVLTGIILYGHASMDRIFGYGLKFGDSFQHTHLGWIGKLKGQEQGQVAGNAR